MARRVTAIEGTEPCAPCQVRAFAAWTLVALVVGYVFTATVTQKPRRRRTA
jgi:thiosulfate reductase cytochrome b subunit